MSEKLEWHAVTLEEIAEITGGGTPKREVHAYWNGNIPWATPTDITNNNKKVIEKTAEYITEEGLKNSSAKLLPVGTVLMTSRATIGYCAINTVPMATNQGFANFICKNNVYNLFLLYLLTFHKDNFEKLGSGSTFKEVAKSTLKSYRVEIPPLPEQRKIAAILSSVDEAIEKTEAIIEQTEKVKKGLMQQLLTKGIGHTRFKKTEIGEIPEEWEVKSISEVAKVVSGGTPSKQVYEYWENGTIPWATPTDITSNDNKYISTTQLMITESGLRNSSANLLPEGSVLMTSRATIGSRCINTVPMATNQGFKSFICDPDVLHNEYLYYLIDKIKDQFIALASGSTFLEISKSAVETFKIPVPPLEEQIEIAKMLSSLDEKLSVEKVKKESLQTIKKGLMQSLLTGKVRVKVDEDEVVSS
ncbi:restriction endonuclease subunit S [Geobacillus thermodenitrificans]|uniref:restriction endonuclease subunit S n=1 Tax=Geobacillus thermodenitrificans TaxID=33940 RepID=UPI002E201EAA|nr:restriction endonuclease subunit S [Geobacillus thermodenitrificans]